jgi:hypothetical protein
MRQELTIIVGKDLDLRQVEGLAKDMYTGEPRDIISASGNHYYFYNHAGLTDDDIGVIMWQFDDHFENTEVEDLVGSEKTKGINDEDLLVYKYFYYGQNRTVEVIDYRKEGK